MVQVNATFSPVPVIKSEVEPKERSFTSAVTVTAPNGEELVDCFGCACAVHGSNCKSLFGMVSGIMHEKLT